ncbi:MAG: hypothetical protein KF901_31560, partial [Myxococcales bacterium]|nr:hypothetical protein [Myxococcales bacterium]
MELWLHLEDLPPNGDEPKVRRAIGSRRFDMLAVKDVVLDGTRDVTLLREAIAIGKDAPAVAILVRLHDRNLSPIHDAVRDPRIAGAAVVAVRVTDEGRARPRPGRRPPRRRASLRPERQTSGVRAAARRSGPTGG